MSNYDDIKAECYEANLLLPEYKLIDLTFGNVSVADPERQVFAIKPSGVDYAAIRVNDMVVGISKETSSRVRFDRRLTRRPTVGYSKRSPAFGRSCTRIRAMLSHSRKPAEGFHVSAPRTPITSTVKCR
jgi:hypothetical protein